MKPLIQHPGSCGHWSGPAHQHDHQLEDVEDGVPCHWEQEAHLHLCGLETLALCFRERRLRGFHEHPFGACYDMLMPQLGSWASLLA